MKAKVIPIKNRIKLNPVERQVMAIVVHSNGLLLPKEVVERIGQDEKEIGRAICRLVDLGKIQIKMDWTLRV